MKTRLLAAALFAGLASSAFALPGASQPVLGEHQPSASHHSSASQAFPTQADSGFERTGNANRVSDSGFERTGNANRVTDSGFERTGNANRVTDSGFERTGNTGKTA